MGVRAGRRLPIARCIGLCRGLEDGDRSRADEVLQRYGQGVTANFIAGPGAAAERRVALFTVEHWVSEFVTELMQDHGLAPTTTDGEAASALLCFKCKKGVMVPRHGMRGRFWACNRSENYRAGQPPPATRLRPGCTAEATVGNFAASQGLRPIWTPELIHHIASRSAVDQLAAVSKNFG